MSILRYLQSKTKGKMDCGGPEFSIAKDLINEQIKVANYLTLEKSYL